MLAIDWFLSYFLFRFDDFAYFNHRYQLPTLNYTICTGGKETLDGQGDLKNLHQHFLPKTFWDGHSQKDISTLKSVLQKPLWQVRTYFQFITYSVFFFQNLWNNFMKKRRLFNFSCMFLNPNIFSNLNLNFSNLSDMRNLQEQVKKAICYQTLFWPFE